MTDFTPGPWSVSGVRVRVGGEPMLQIGAGDKVYAYVLYGDGSNKQHIQAHADARLIAAAPKMYAALQELAGVCGLHTHGWQVARTALDKVDGIDNRQRKLP